MTTQFKAGDSVLCAENAPLSWVRFGVYRGERYRVAEAWRSGRIQLAGLSDLWSFEAEYFVHHVPAGASAEAVPPREKPAPEVQPSEKPACASCSAPFTPAPIADYSDTTRCVYCQCRELSAYADTRPALSRALPDRTPKRKPSRHDARPIDLEQAWSTPGCES